MIIVTVEVELVDDVIGNMREAFQTMDDKTAEEGGCLKYVSSVDVNNPKIIRIYEMWETMEALALHFQTPHMAEFQRAFSGAQAKSMESKVYEVGRELEFPN